METKSQRPETFKHLIDVVEKTIRNEIKNLLPQNSSQEIKFGGVKKPAIIYDAENNIKIAGVWKDEDDNISLILVDDDSNKFYSDLENVRDVYVLEKIYSNVFLSQ